jgi:hypothetical protein
MGSGNSLVYGTKVLSCSAYESLRHKVIKHIGVYKPATAFGN